MLAVANEKANKIAMALPSKGKLKKTVPKAKPKTQLNQLSTLQTSIYGLNQRKILKTASIDIEASPLQTTIILII